MIKFYGIGIENSILEGADVLNYTTDLLGQVVLVRQPLSLGPHSRYLGLSLLGEAVVRYCASVIHVLPLVQ
jgi:hypothetical protein